MDGERGHFRAVALRKHRPRGHFRANKLIVAAILDESLPDHVTLFDLASGTPLLWDEQRTILCL